MRTSVLKLVSIVLITLSSQAILANEYVIPNRAEYVGPHFGLRFGKPIEFMADFSQSVTMDQKTYKMDFIMDKKFSDKCQLLAVVYDKKISSYINLYGKVLDKNPRTLVVTHNITDNDISDLYDDVDRCIGGFGSVVYLND